MPSSTIDKFSAEDHEDIALALLEIQEPAGFSLAFIFKFMSLGLGEKTL